jgi:hypothetical protein
MLDGRALQACSAFRDFRSRDHTVGSPAFGVAELYLVRD